MQAVELAVDELDEAAALLLRARRCATHIIGDSVSATIAGDGDRAGERERELGEQRAGEPALEADRHVHRDQHDRHRDDRPAQLARRAQRGLERRLAFLLHVPVDVLDDDDGVVDDEADRQHQREQRQQIDRVAEHQHHEEGADQRQRHRDQRDQRPRAGCRGTGRSRALTMSERLEQRLDDLARSSC